MTGTARTDALQLLKRESWRCRSFEEWPHQNILGISKEDMARAGFFFIGSPDKVQCAFCLISIRNWSIMDSAMGCHIRYTMCGRRSFCPFIQGYEVGNIPIDPVSGFDAEDDDDAIHINSINLRMSSAWPGGTLFNFDMYQNKKIN